MKQINELKESQKTHAKEIRGLKQEIKKLQRNGAYAGVRQLQQQSASWKYRLNHIAYSLLRGRSYEEIEKPKDCNALSESHWKIIEETKNAYAKEDVRLSA